VIAKRFSDSCRVEGGAYEIRMRAARKANQIYDAGEKAAPPKGNQYTGKMVRPDNPAEPKTLKDLGISSQQMSEWRKLNTLSDDKEHGYLRIRKRDTVLAVRPAMRMVAAVMLAGSQAMAAEIKEDRSLARPPFDSVVTVTGEIVKGDSDKFDAVVAARHPLVELNSPGGDLMEGLAIGETIRLRHLATYVAPNSGCLSVCAFAWLAGKPRGVDRSATVLFQRPRSVEGNQDLNAVVVS
jgi:hypothetical protein